MTVFHFSIIFFICNSLGSAHRKFARFCYLNALNSKPSLNSDADKARSCKISVKQV